MKDFPLNMATQHTCMSPRWQTKRNQFEIFIMYNSGTDIQIVGVRE